MKNFNVKIVCVSLMVLVLFAGQVNAGKSLTPLTIRLTWLMTFGIGKNLIGAMEHHVWRKSVDILYEFKQIDKKIPAGDLFTLEFLN